MWWGRRQKEVFLYMFQKKLELEAAVRYVVSEGLQY